MGVVDQNGVVGMVNIVGDHTARVISPLNPKMRLSCKVKGREYFGSLVWDGKAPMKHCLKRCLDMKHSAKARHYCHKRIFGSVSTRHTGGNHHKPRKEHDDNFYALRIKLFTDFSRLSTVRA